MKTVQMHPRALHRIFAIAAALLVAFSIGTAHAEGDPAAYNAAVSALDQAGGGKACVECFLKKYGPAEFNKAFAVSKDGAYGARWKKGMPIEQAREAALESCQKKPTYNAENPCVIFFENDKLIWKP